MSFTKKQRYQSGYLKLINRKILYTEPIFLLDVKFDNDTSIYAKQGGESDIDKFVVSLPIQINKSKTVLFNIAQFAAKPQKNISLALRNIVLKKPVDFKLTSISSKIISIYKDIIDTYDIKKYDMVEFPKNVFAEVDGMNSKNIAIIDFNVSSQVDADIAAILKQLFFNHDTGESVCASKESIIQYMQSKKYKVVVDCKLVYNMLEPYCLVFGKE